jgi:hypothetical protein
MLISAARILSLWLTGTRKVHTLKATHFVKNYFFAAPPGVLAKCLYSNQLLAYVAVQHYIYGNTLGQTEKSIGIGYSSLVDAMHHLSKRRKDVPKALREAYRQAAVKQAAETGWRTDGHNGYAWLFCTPDMSIFRFLGHYGQTIQTPGS